MTTWILDGVVKNITEHKCNCEKTAILLSFVQIKYYQLQLCVDNLYLHFKTKKINV